MRFVQRAIGCGSVGSSFPFTFWGDDADEFRGYIDVAVDHVQKILTRNHDLRVFQDHGGIIVVCLRSAPNSP